MEKKKITAENPISINGLKLLPVVETVVKRWEFNHKISYAGYKSPLVLVTAVSEVKRAYRMSGEEIKIDDLIKEYPEIKGMVENL